jgi:Subtilase family/Bacterial Ig domain
VEGHARLRRTASIAVLATIALSAAAFGANPDFPGTNPNESVRIHTPDDPEFDRCEPHPPGEGTQTCTGAFGQEFERFGFAPNGTHHSAIYKNPTDPHVARLMAQNTLAGRNPAGQVSGVSADRAWKFSIGDPAVQVGIVDTGIEWHNEHLRTKAWLNAGELPTPLHDRTTPLSDGADCSTYVSADDANGDGAFDVLDFVCDSRADAAAGPNGNDARLDAQDLIHDPDFSDGADTDGNGYVDDVSGWDFFDDDNDPHDASSYSTADGHGSGRAEEAAQRTNDGEGGTAVCPRCQFVPLRAWDSFVLDTNNFGMAVTYAADNDIEVIEGAVGGLYNTRFNRDAFEYAYERGVFFAIVSSDANTAAHNYPTVYNESLMVAGVVADQHGLSNEDADYPQPMLDFFNEFGVPIVPANAPVATWFRNSGLTQYGGHAGIVMPATSGSEGTGQASGAAGLLMSYGRQRSAADPLFGPPLEPNEVKQILTLSAEDVVPENTVGVGVPDPAQVGWDQHFGYGRPDLGLAMEWIRDRKIPPQALITSPDWFQPLNADDVDTVAIGGRVSADRAAAYTWKLQWAPGIEPCESEFVDVGGTHPETGAYEGPLGTIDVDAVRAALDARVAAAPDPACRRTPGPVQGGSTVDPTAPKPGPGDRDPNEPAFTVRVVVEAGTNRGEHRKVLFAYDDPDVHDGWSSKNLGAGGESSQRLFDLDGDNDLDTVQADSGGRLRVFDHDGTPLTSFNSGNPVFTRQTANVHPGAPAYATVDPPLEVLRTPVIGDIDGDMEPEIVDSAGEYVYAWNADGSEVTGFPVRLDPDFSRPEDRTKQNHVKRGFHASPSLGDFDGDGRLDVTVPGMDQHLYAWDGEGDPLPGFPRKLKKPGETNAQVAGAEAVTTASVGDIVGDAKPEIVTPTNEVTAASSPISQLEPGNNRIYAVEGDGDLVPGWPAEPSGPLPGIIPFFGPSIENALGDLDADGKHETVGGITSGDVKAYDGSGEEQASYVPEPVASSEVADRTLVVNTFEYPTVANLNGGDTLEVLKGGITLQGVANLLLVGQNQVYNHVLQAWDGESGNPLPGWPQVVEDYQWGSNPAVADVSDAPGNEVLAPTGLYTVRNLNSQGIEGSRWPKFTGGWGMATPAVGDADGDGKLEVAHVTREGNAFLWDTESPACGTNDEWWTSRHDEWNTGAYGTDTRPPGTPRGLVASRAGTTVSLTWTTPGDDWLCGGPKRFRVISADAPIEHPTDGTVEGEFDTTKQAGEGETRTFTGIATGRPMAVLYQDDAGNWGHLASVSTAGAPGNALPICADVGPLPVERDQSKPIDLVCADPDGTPLELSVVDAPDHGSLDAIDQSTDTVVYTPDDGYTGPDSFTYKASDGTADSAPATVTLEVTPAPNRAPDCDDVGPLQVVHGGTREVALKCSDPDGDGLAITIVDRPSKGTLGQVDQQDDTVVYTADPGESGADSFTYRANDARTDSDVATVRLEIDPAQAPDPPPEAPPPPIVGPPLLPLPPPLVPERCEAGNGFSSASVTPRGRGALLAFTRRAEGIVQVDVYQQAIRRRVIRGRLVARFAPRGDVLAWNGRANRPRRRVTDGYYLVRFRMRRSNGDTSYRRVALRRSRGRFSLRPPFYQDDSCGLVRAFKLSGPAFGGRTRRALGISYMLNQPATVRVDVLRGRRVVRTWRARRRRAGVMFRHRLGAVRRRRGDHRVVLTAVRGGVLTRAVLVARRI